VTLRVAIESVGSAGVRALRIPASATRSAARATITSGTESAAANTIKNNFGLLIGHVALRYSEEQVSASTNAVARQLALSSFGVFVVAATLASLALLALMSRLARDFDAVEATLRSADPLRPSEAVRKGPFGRALRGFLERVRSAEAEIAMLRGNLERGVER